MKLFYIEADGEDASFHIVAPSWSAAIERWRGFMVTDIDDTITDPDAIHLVCDDHELLIWTEKR